MIRASGDKYIKNRGENINNIIIIMIIIIFNLILRVNEQKQVVKPARVCVPVCVYVYDMLFSLSLRLHIVIEIGGKLGSTLFKNATIKLIRQMKTILHIELISF